MKKSPFHMVALSATLALLFAACSTSAATSSPTSPAMPGSAEPSAMESPAATSEAPSAVGLAGDWSGTWQDTSPDDSTGTFSLTWTQSGSGLSGTISVGGTPCIGDGTVTGTLNGSSITFGAVSGQIQISYTGSVSSDMQTMQGTYSAPEACGNATGNWTATKS
jgi:hypothetical protein